MLRWLSENTTSEIIILCSIVLGIRQNTIRKQIVGLRKEVLDELLNAQLRAEQEESTGMRTLDGH
jgi:hypothetical protein